MPVESTYPPTGTPPQPPEQNPGTASVLSSWGNVAMAAILMLATLPGRTQGLGLITEPLLHDLRLDRLSYANINFWATVLGSLFCLPAGWLIDRCGLRRTTLGLLLPLSFIVWRMSVLSGSGLLLFVLVLLTRGLGQSALSVASITAVGKSFGLRAGWAMGVYSVLLSVLFAVAFVVVGGVVHNQGWRVAWMQVAMGLLVVAALTPFFLREPTCPAGAIAVENGVGIGVALRTPLFWVFAGATALFGLVSSGFGLFNEAILAERGFDQTTYHNFLAVTTVCALFGQMLCGWLTLRQSMSRLLAAAMFLYAGGLATLSWLHTLSQLWIFSAVFGVAVGFVTVIFFAVWGHAFGRAHLGRIQGAAQMLTVFASAVGPLLFAKSYASAGSYTPLLHTLGIIVFCSGLLAWFTKLSPHHSASNSTL